MRLVTRFLALALLATTALPCLADEPWHPTILPVQEIDFNWPPPREVGEADYFVVARDGKAVCSIVIPAAPSTYVEKSAKLLKLYLDLVTGASFEIKREPASGPAIYIGETEVGKKVRLDLPPIKYASLTLPNLHGFLVKTVDKNTLVIRGEHKLGTVYGVVSFIREYVGIRRYWPSEPGGIGDVYTPRPTLTIPKITWKDWPYLISRHVGFNAKAWELTRDGEWPWMFFWYRLGTNLSMMHNFFKLIPPEEYGESHPEYFPEINGVRVIPKGKIHWQPCVSNPEVVEICARKITEAFDSAPYRICHALAVNDGAGHCECAECRAMDSPDADVNTTQLTDRYVKFMNAVAERVAAKHPDRLIGFLAYGAVRFPPTTAELHPNLVPYFCAMGRGVYPGWDDWMAAGAKNMGHYGYHDDRWFTIPKINPHQEARRIRYMVGTNVFRGYYKEFNPTYPLDAHAAIVCADMQWDPRLDEDKILARYYSDMFVESAPEMRAFYETLEADYEDWLKETSPPHPYGPDRSDLDLDHNYEQFQVLTPEGADKAWDWLLKAEAKAEDSKVKERIALVRSIFNFVRLCDHEYWLIKSLPDAKSAVEAEAQAREVLRLARKKAVVKERVMEGPTVKPWTMIYRRPYDEIKVGVIPQEVYMAIDQAFEAAYRANPKDTAQWMRLMRDADPVIAHSADAAFAMAAWKALPGLVGLSNLLDDPGFESGTKPELIDHGPKKGSVAISEESPHSGRRCAMVYDCKTSSLVKSFPAKPGEKFWISAWLRARQFPGPRDVPALHGIRINANKGEKVVDWTRVPATVGDRWQRIRLPYTAPADTESIDVLVYAMRQHAKARLWVDDVSVVRVPVEPVSLGTADATGALQEGPPEE